MATVKEDLVSVIADNLNKMDKEAKYAYFIGEESTPTDFSDFISTGSSTLDLAIGNRPHAGIAVGRITEMTGLEGSGKSLICAHMLADTQKRGGIGVLIDTENAVNQEFFEAVGVDFKKLIYSPVTTVEEIFAIIEKVIESVRKASKDKLVTIVVDSVAGASTEQEMASDYGKDGYATGKAIIIGKAMRKITTMLGKQRIALVFTNQLRQKLNAMAFSDPWTTSGGKAIAFHASTRIRLSVAGKIKNKAGDVVGVKVKAVVVKNRLGPPFRSAEFDVYFDRGIDNFGSWLKVMKDNGLVRQAGAYSKYLDPSGEEHQFQASGFEEFLTSDLERMESIYQSICESVIMSYKTEGATEGDFEVESDNLPSE